MLNWLLTREPGLGHNWGVYDTFRSQVFQSISDVCRQTPAFSAVWCAFAGST